MSLLALEASQRAAGLAVTLLVQLTPEHERGLGQWQSQWLTLRTLLCATASGLAAMADALEGLEVDTAAMRANLARTRGLVFSEAVSARLSHALGKPRAHALTKALCEAAVHEGRSLEEVFGGNSEASAAVPPEERASLFDYAAQFGVAPQAIERVLAQWAALAASLR